MLKQTMEYHNEIITIASLRKDAANHRKLQPKTEQLTTNAEKRNEGYNLESKEDNCLLTTKEASKLLGCSMATLWSYAREAFSNLGKEKREG